MLTRDEVDTLRACYKCTCEVCARRKACIEKALRIIELQTIELEQLRALRQGGADLALLNGQRGGAPQ